MVTAEQALAQVVDPINSDVKLLMAPPLGTIISGDTRMSSRSA